MTWNGGEGDANTEKIIATVMKPIYFAIVSIDHLIVQIIFLILFKDLTLLRDENTELNSQLNILKKYSLSLQRRLKDETDKNSKIVEVLHEGLFQDEEYQCPVCKEVLIKVQL